MGFVDLTDLDELGRGLYGCLLLLLDVAVFCFWVVVWDATCFGLIAGFFQGYCFCCLCYLLLFGYVEIWVWTLTAGLRDSLGWVVWGVLFAWYVSLFTWLLRLWIWVSFVCLVGWVFAFCCLCTWLLKLGFLLVVVNYLLIAAMLWVCYLFTMFARLLLGFVFFALTFGFYCVRFCWLVLVKQFALIRCLLDSWDTGCLFACETSATICLF